MTLVVGERTGDLTHSFKLLYQYYERRIEGRQEITKLLFYPGLILMNLIFVAGFLLTVILPGIKELYDTAGAEMPKLLSGLIYGSTLLKDQMPWILLIMAAMCLSVELIKRKELFWEEIPWRMPGISQVLQKLFIKRFSWMFASLLHAGVDEISAIKAISELEKGKYVSRCLHEILIKVQKGKRLSRCFVEYPKLFDTLYVLYLGQGEKIQALGAHAQTLAEINEKNAQKFISDLIRYAQPLLILFLGLLIGAVLLALLPLLDMTSLYGN